MTIRSRTAVLFDSLHRLLSCSDSIHCAAIDPSRKDGDWGAVGFCPNRRGIETTMDSKDTVVADSDFVPGWWLAVIWCRIDSSRLSCFAAALDGELYNVEAVWASPSA